MKTRLFASMVVVFFFAVSCLAQKPADTIKVTLDANQWDSDLILKKLNEHGADHGLKFAVDEKSYEYRIAFATGQERNIAGVDGSGGTSNTSEARAAAYDVSGTELFSFKRENRKTDSGAANAVAKEIIKRLLKLRVRGTGLSADVGR